MSNGAILKQIYESDVHQLKALMGVVSLTD